MSIQEITDIEIWENFLSNFDPVNKTFLHSWSWGEFQKSLGNKIWRYGVFSKEKKIIGVALIIKIKAKRGTYLLCPHGPYILDEKAYPFFFSKIKELAKKEKAVCVRIAPFIERTDKNIKLFTENKAIRSPLHTHAERTWVLDITPNEETLLKNMRKTTRYCIKKAIKEEGLVIKTKNKISEKDISTYLMLQEDTKKRHGWTPYSRKYIEEQTKIFSKHNEVSIITAEYNNEPLASAIIFYWQKIGFYFHGASSSKDHKINAPYLIQWEAIKEGKRRGCSLYNFWGIADLDEVPKSHPWYGITLFKKGFGGFEQRLVYSFDFPVSYKYFFTYAIEKIRKWKRKL